MKKMKKLLISALLVFTLCLFTACGNADNAAATRDALPGAVSVC